MINIQYFNIFILLLLLYLVNFEITINIAQNSSVFAQHRI